MTIGAGVPTNSVDQYVRYIASLEARIAELERVANRGFGLSVPTVSVAFNEAPDTWAVAATNTPGPNSLAVIYSESDDIWNVSASGGGGSPADGIVTEAGDYWVTETGDFVTWD